MTSLATHKVRVGLIDDHPLVREGLENVVQEIPGARLALSCADSEEALRCLEDQQLDVLLLDITLGGESGLSLIEPILAIQPEMKIVMLTVSDDAACAAEAFARGAYGYLSKECDKSQIVSAILAAASGLAVWAPPPILTSYFQRGSPKNEKVDVFGPTLSERELEILKMVAEGLSNEEIGARLSLAQSTIKKYCHGAMGKLGVTSRGAAAIRAIRLGLISIEDDLDATS